MISPEKLLAGLLLGRGGSFAGRSGIGLGILGVAMEAAEHYMNQNSSRPPATPPPPPSSFSEAAVPPPPPGAGRPPLPGDTAKADAAEELAAKPGDAVLLIRAMIAAANADGSIDSDERSRILRQLKIVGLNAEEQAFITEELLAPSDLETIANQVKTPQVAKQVYAASLAAITLDTEAERAYMHRLARQIGIDDTTRQQISARLVS